MVCALGSLWSLSPVGRGELASPGSPPPRRDSAAPACWSEERGFPDGPSPMLQYLLVAMPGKQAEEQPQVVPHPAHLS